MLRRGHAGLCAGVIVTAWGPRLPRHVFGVVTDKKRRRQAPPGAPQALKLFGRVGIPILCIRAARKCKRD